MRLIVQKYGGTSVQTPERIRNVARRLIETQQSGCRVVAVISAMAGVTDGLIKLARETSPQPEERELDALLATGEQAAIALTAMAVNALGGKAISLTGAEAGILTDRAHTRAKIANISPRQIHALLADDYLRREGLDGAELYVLMLLSASGGVIMAMRHRDDDGATLSLFLRCGWPVVISRSPSLPAASSMMRRRSWGRDDTIWPMRPCSMIA